MAINKNEGRLTNLFNSLHGMSIKKFRHMMQDQYLKGYRASDIKWKNKIKECSKRIQR